MRDLSLPILGWLTSSIALQIIAVSLLPRTLGFTKTLPTLVCCVLFLLGIACMARIIHAGVQLGILVPVMSALVPLATIVVGVVAYGESASAVKVGLLISACGAIAWAAVMG